MFILWAIAAASVLVFFGYIAMLGTIQAGVPQSISKFGKILSIALFVVAGLVLIFSLSQGLFRRNPMMGRPSYNFGPMMQRGQGVNPYGAVRPNIAANQPGQVATPVVTPNQGVQPNVGAMKRGVPVTRKIK